MNRFYTDLLLESLSLFDILLPQDKGLILINPSSTLIEKPLIDKHYPIDLLLVAGKQTPFRCC